MSFAGANQQELLFILKMRDEATKVLGQHGQGLRQTGQEAKRTKADLDDMARSVRDVTVAIGAMVGAFMALRRSAEDFRGFEKGMANVATLIPGATGRVQDLSQEVLELSVDSGTSFDVMTDGLYQVISAFGDTADTMDQLRIANEAGIAGLSSTQDAVSLLSAVTKAYGDTSAEAQQKVSDLAFQTVKLGETTFPELARSMFRSTAMASELGVSQEELFGIFATGTGVLGGAAEVATNFRQVLQSFMVPTETMTELMTELGFANGKAMIDTLGLQGAMMAVRKAADDSGTSLQRYTTGIEGVSAMLTFTGAQADALATKTAAMFDAAGSAAAAYLIQQDTLDGSLRRLSASADAISVQFGEALSPALRGTADEVQALVKWFMELDPEVRTAIATAVALTAGLATTAVAVRGLVVAFRLLGLSMMATPWGLAIAAAGALGIGLVTLGGANDTVARATRMHRDELDEIRRTMGDTTLASDQLTESLKERARLDLTATLREAEANARDLFKRLDRASFQGLFDGFAHLPIPVGRQFNELREQFRAGELSTTDYANAVAALGNRLEEQSPKGFAYARSLLETIEVLEAAELAAANARQAIADLDNPKAPVEAPTKPLALDIGGGVVPGKKDDGSAAREQERRDAFMRDIARQTALLREEAQALRLGERAYVDWQLAREIEAPVESFTEQALGLQIEQTVVDALTAAYREQALAKQDAALALEAEANSAELRRQIGLIEDETAAIQAGEAAYAEWQQMRAIEAPIEQFTLMAEGLRMEKTAVEELTEAYREAAIAKGVAAEEAQAAAAATAEAQALSDDLAGAFTNTARDMIFNAGSIEDAMASLARQLAEVIIQAAVLAPMKAAISASMMTMFAAEHGRAFMGGELVPMAKGGTGSGGILKTPTLFPMRSGNVALGGELEDEAIMPLTRLPNGDLGVQALGGGGRGGNQNMALTVNTSIVVEGGSQGQAADQLLAQQLGRQVEQAVDVAVARNLRQHMRAGNMLNPVSGGRH